MSTVPWQQTLTLPASTFPTSPAPRSSLPHYSTEHIPQVPFYNFQTPDIPFGSMMNLALPQTAPSYQQPSYSYPPIQDNHLFYPWQYPNVYHYQPVSYQAEIPSAIPQSIATPLSHNIHGHGCEQRNNQSSLDPPSDLFFMAPPIVAEDSAPDYEYSTSPFSPTPSNGTADSSGTESSSTSHHRERTRRPLYVPRINRTKLSLLNGVLCDIVFRCEWESCGTVYQLEGESEAEETTFQNRVLKHLSEHAFLSSRASEDKKLQCQWGDCQRQMSTTTKGRGMVRHLQSHIATWYYFCPNYGCSYTSSRKVLKSHSNFCKTKAHH